LLFQTQTMTNRAALPIALLSLSLASGAALSGCATATGDGGDSLPELEMPTCDSNQAIVSGDVDGDKVEAASTTVVSKAFADARALDDYGYLDVELAGGDHVSLSWNEPLRDGGAAAATGVIDRAAGDLSYASCAGDGFLGLVQIDLATGNLSFHLTGLHRGGACDLSQTEGEIVGCVGAVTTPLAEQAAPAGRVYTSN